MFVVLDVKMNFNKIKNFRQSLTKAYFFFRREQFQNNIRRLIGMFNHPIYTKELSVPTFCKLSVNVPYNVDLTPLDVHEYHNCDRLLVKVYSSNKAKTILDSINCIHNGNNIEITDSQCSTNLKDITCKIEAPIKANLNITSKDGDISISNFNGDTIKACSAEGNISINKYQGEEINIITTNGSIFFKGVVQASKIQAFISGIGSISTDRLQGLKSRLETKFGNISVNSSYCNESQYETQQGDMILKNIHKSCKVISHTSGNIKIIGLDGELDLFQGNGKSDVQLSRVTEDSKIILSKGHLILRLSEECQETVGLKVRSKHTNVDENICLTRRISDDNLLLTPSQEKYKLVLLDCQNSIVDIKAASWTDMFEVVRKA